MLSVNRVLGVEAVRRLQTTHKRHSSQALRIIAPTENRLTNFSAIHDGSHNATSSIAIRIAANIGLLPDSIRVPTQPGIEKAEHTDLIISPDIPV